jgi:hypothetical protein
MRVYLPATLLLLVGVVVEMEISVVVEVVALERGHCCQVQPR